jgi:hypothetical protein
MRRPLLGPSERNIHLVVGMVVRLEQLANEVTEVHDFSIIEEAEGF